MFYIKANILSSLDKIMINAVKGLIKNDVDHTVVNHAKRDILNWAMVKNFLQLLILGIIFVFEAAKPL